MEFVLSQLEVSDGVRAVLLDEPTAPPALKRAYTLAKACERGAWGIVVEAAAGLRLTQPEIASMYYESLVWADEAFVSAAAA
jgi:hypothetical protein